MRNRLIGMSVFMGMALACASSARAAEKAPAAMDEKAMMEQMQKYGTPGVGHQMLQQAAGSWTHTVRMWMKPGDKAQESKGTSVNTLVLSGRFLKQEAKGDMGGMPFEGLGFTGFDNLSQEYQSVWMDSMGTGMMIGRGPYDPVAKAIKQTGTFSCPITLDKAMWYRTEWKIIDNDNQVFTMYSKAPDGKEFKGMEIIYKRAK